MQNDIPKPLIIGIIVILVLIIVGVGIKVFGGNPDVSPNSKEAQEQFKAAHENSAINQHVKSGQSSATGATGAVGTPDGTSNSAFGAQTGTYTPVQGGRGVHTSQKLGNQ